MSYKTILVHVDNSARASVRIAVAANLAMRQEAHLVGTAMTGLSPFVFPVGGFDPGIASVTFPFDELRADAERALDAFEAQVRRIGVASFERRRVDDEAGPGISMQARYCDLVVLGQFDQHNPVLRLRADFPEYALLNSARPVLLVPAAGSMGEFGKRVLVGWNGGTEATRALTSAIPLLRRAEQVDLVVFNADDEGDLHGDLAGADMALYLARHGIKVNVSSAEVGTDTGSALLAQASSSNADLIVMGAYGRSRFREIMLGGATRTVLRRSTVPLWMAH